MREGAGLTRFQTGIAAKLGVCLVVSVTAILATLGYLNLRLHRKHSQDLVLASAERLSDIILQSTRQQMLRNDRDVLYHTIGDIGAEPGISRVRIFNKEGRISFSTDRNEVGRIVDKQAEACYACHAQGVPLERLNRPDSSRIFSGAAGQRVLAMIRPIRNEPTCSSAACHAHPPEKKVLGVIDVHLSLAAVDRQASDQSRMLAWSSIGAIVLICAVSGWFVVIVVHKPIKALIAGTHRVAGGDLTYRLEPASTDELGDLARSFNKMTSELCDAHKELSQWAAELEDRVHRKTDELERAHKYLVGSEKMAGIGKLAATVAHEVNNPLFGILTYARLCLKELERDEIDPAVRERMMNQLRIIERESRRCGDIIKNLLTYARQAPRKRESNDVNAIVDRAVALVRHQFKLQSVELDVEVDPALPTIVCDAGQVQQVILILLTNAAEATGEGGHLWLRTEPLAGGIRVVVKDDGGGVPPEILPQIFEPFFTTKEDKLRTGLGLAVAKSIVEQHGGAIEAQSEPGKGAAFIVTLPLEAPAQTVRGTAA
jgi:two-component system NtrC family sensor kinase